MNRNFSTIISTEIYKLRRNKMRFVVPAAFFLLTIFLFIGLSAAAVRSYFGLPNGFYLTSAGLSWLINIIVLFLVIITSFQISNEFAMGTVKSVWVSPVSRRAWLSGKIIYLCLIAALLLFCSTILLLLLSWIKFGLTDLAEKNYVIHSASSLGLRLILVLSLTLITLFAVVCFASAISTLFCRPGSSIAMLLSIGFLMMVIGILPVLKGFLLITYISSPLEQMTAMAKGLPLPFSWSELIMQTLIVSGVYMIISISAGQLLITKKEIKF
ncbi:MAG TPA: ABC transporter permease [Candidatus Krumholzibacteriaceae bacterium]|nr:ABC transporter permease [Candidatus Krumholzibacteriaceae bacterium]